MSDQRLSTRSRLGNDPRCRVFPMSYVELLADAVADRATASSSSTGPADILFANNAAHQMFGYRARRAGGNVVDALVPASVRKTNTSLATAAVFSRSETRRLKSDRIFEGQRKDGSRFPIEVGLTPTAHEAAPSSSPS